MEESALASNQEFATSQPGEPGSSSLDAIVGRMVRRLYAGEMKERIKRETDFSRQLNRTESEASFYLRNTA